MSGLMSGLSQADLLELRRKSGNQKELAPYEHMAFTREQVERDPKNAVALFGAVPAYQLMKLLGIVDARTPASIAQLLAGWKGIGQGMSGLLGK